MHFLSELKAEALIPELYENPAAFKNRFCQYVSSMLSMEMP